MLLFIKTLHWINQEVIITYPPFIEHVVITFYFCNCANIKIGQSMNRRILASVPTRHYYLSNNLPNWLSYIYIYIYIYIFINYLSKDHFRSINWLWITIATSWRCYWFELEANHEECVNMISTIPSNIVLFAFIEYTTLSSNNGHLDQTIGYHETNDCINYHWTTNASYYLFNLLHCTQSGWTLHLKFP